jgi:hypothetical protein
VAGTVDAYTLLEGRGCSLGVEGNDFTYKDFKFSVVEGTLLPTEVDVNPLVQSRTLNLGLSSPFFFVPSGGRLVVKFEYVLDPPPPILEDMSLSMDAQSPFAPGFATIDVDLCAGGEFSNQNCDFEHRQFTLIHYGDGDLRNVLAGSVHFTPTNIVHVRTVITLDGGPAGQGGSSQIDGFSYASTAIPEPAAVLLTGGGIGLVLLLRRRRSRMSA